MTASQLQLELRPCRPASIDLMRRHAELVDLLRGRGWVTSAELSRLTFTDRELRAIVEHDERGQILSFPGSPGYKLTIDATLAELDRTGALLSQGKRMIRRWVRYSRVRHGASVLRTPPAEVSRTEGELRP